MTRYVALVDGEAGAYGVVFPDLPGCTAMGATIEVALFNAGAALRDFVELSEADGDVVAAPRPLEDVRRDPEVVTELGRGSSLASVPLVRPTGRPIKANLSLDAGVLAAIDAEAARRKLTRSGLVELLARHGLADLP